MGYNLLPDEGTRGLDALDDGVLVVGKGRWGVALHGVHLQPHHLLGGEWLRRCLAGQHAGRQAGARESGGKKERNEQRNHVCTVLLIVLFFFPPP